MFWAFLLITAEICTAQVCGCTDSLATNYNSDATVNDGSCLYAHTTIHPVLVRELDTLLDGTSSLFYWQNNYWTYNDWFDSCLYRIDSIYGTITGTICIQDIHNRNTEEITQDSLYLYLGAFGNNHGNSHNLHILRIRKSSIFNQSIEIDTIYFFYEDQTDFSDNLDNSDYDCEAFIATDDSLYLFTKQWASNQTTVYVIPKVPGHYAAHRRQTYNVNGLITGATYLPNYRLVVLCGYDYNSNDIMSALHPFIVLLYDFQGYDFFSGNKRRLDFEALEKNQVEAIATTNALDYYITNEHFHKTFNGYLTIDFPAQLQRLDLREYLVPYLSQYIDSFPPPPDTLSQPDTTLTPDGIQNLQNATDNFSIYPNPAKDQLLLDYPQAFRGAEYAIFNLQGQKVAEGVLIENAIPLNNRNMPTGQYILTIRGNGILKAIPFIKKQ